MKITLLLSVFFALSFLAVEMPKRLKVVGTPVTYACGKEKRRNRRKKSK